MKRNNHISSFVNAQPLGTTILTLSHAGHMAYRRNEQSSHPPHESAGEPE